MKLIEDIKKSWYVIWEHYISKPLVRVGEMGCFQMNGVLVFMERVK